MDVSYKPLHFTGQLYPFQQKVLEWAQTINQGILGLDMGLGKTPITIALVCAKNFERVIIVLPLQIVEQWRQSLLKFSSLLVNEIAIYQGPQRKSLNLATYRVILTTYDVVRSEMIKDDSQLARSKHLFDCLILDEAHKIRNKKTGAYKMCYCLAHVIKEKWLLTGTTIHNKFADFSTLADFLGLELTPPLEVWRQKYYYRLTKLQAQLDLPDKSIHNHYLSFGKLHFEEYMEVYSQVKKMYEDYLMEPTYMNFSILLVKILRLRQCCNHPDAMLDEKQYLIPSNRHDKMITAKFIKILSIITVASEDDKIIIFSQWGHSLNLLQNHLNRHGIGFLRYDGSKNISERNQILKEFKESSLRVLLITLTSGGVGLDLSFANHVVIMDSWWNQALEEQAIDRVYRIGQTKKVEVHRLYMKGTIEEWMIEMKKEKKKVDLQFHDDSKVYYIDQGLLSKILHMYV